MNTGILAIWNDCEPSAVATYERWYVEEHLYDRVGVAGFRYGRRYEALDGTPRYFTFYETATPHVMFSSDYLERIASPSPRTNAVMPSFRSMCRTVCRRAAHLGLHMAAGCVLTGRLTVAEERRSAVTEALQQAAQALMEQPDVLGAQVWEAMPDEAPANREEAIRPDPDRHIDAALVVATMRPSGARAVMASGTVASLGQDFAMEAGVYQLLCELRHEEAIAGP